MTEKTPEENLADLMKTAEEAIARYQAALDEEIARDPDGVDPRFVIYTGDQRIYRDVVQSRKDGNVFGYELGKAWGVTNVYRFQSRRQAELVAPYIRNFAKERGQVCTYRDALEDSIKETVQLRVMCQQARVTRLVQA